jgi:hypothetical protein
VPGNQEVLRLAQLLPEEADVRRELHRAALAILPTRRDVGGEGPALH